MKNSPLLKFTLIASLMLPLAVEAQDQKKPKPKRKSNPAFAPVEDVAGLPRVLLIGDSISIGYTVAVQELLKGKANVHRPAANCGPTHTAIAKMDDWLATGGADKKWDVIHFNWGLHDLKYMGKEGGNLADPKGEGSHQQVPPAEYEKNLRTLVAKLKETGAKLIWRNTTPVPEGASGRVVGDSKKYNEIAAKVMKDNDIPTNDLYSFSLANEGIQLPKNVHYSPDGSRKLAEDVVKSIEAALADQ